MDTEKSRIGVLISGGDCAGLNTAVKWLTKTALDVRLWEKYRANFEVIGIKDGFRGLSSSDYPPKVLEEYTIALSEEIVDHWDSYGESLLGTSLFNPYNEKNSSDSMLLHNIDRLQLDCLVVIGGNISLNIANNLAKTGVKIVGIPKTIESNIPGTDYCLGFETALKVIADIVDKARTSAISHHWVFVLEVIGKTAGWLALRSGESCGAYIILIPEYDFSMEKVSELIIDGKRKGYRYNIVVASEGAKPIGSKPFVSNNKYDEAGRESSRGIGEYLSRTIYETTGLVSKSLVLGHVQQGGMPCTYDHRMARYYGIAAANLIFRKDFGKMVSYTNGCFTSVPLEEIAGGYNLVDTTTMYDTQKYNGTKTI